MNDDEIICAYGFDKLTPKGKQEFKNFLRVLKIMKSDKLYPTFSKQEKDALFKRITSELKKENGNERY